METIDLVDQELLKELNVFKAKSIADLKRLRAEPIKKLYSIFGKEYPFIAWCESDPDDALVLIVELKKRHLFWGGYTCYRKGFRHKNGTITELSKSELWEYD